MQPYPKGWIAKRVTAQLTGYVFCLGQVIETERRHHAKMQCASDKKLRKYLLCLILEDVATPWGCQLYHSVAPAGYYSLPTPNFQRVPRTCGHQKKIIRLEQSKKINGIYFLFPHQ